MWPAGISSSVGGSSDGLCGMAHKRLGQRKWSPNMLKKVTCSVSRIKSSAVVVILGPRGSPGICDLHVSTKRLVFSRALVQASLFYIMKG